MFVENSLVWRTAVLAYEEAVDAVRGVRDDPFERREVAANVGLDPRLQAKFDSPHLRLHFLYRSLRLAIGLRIMRRGVLEHGVVWPIGVGRILHGSQGWLTVALEDHPRVPSGIDALRGRPDDPLVAAAFARHQMRECILGPSIAADQHCAITLFGIVLTRLRVVDAHLRQAVFFLCTRRLIVWVFASPRLDASGTPRPIRQMRSVVFLAFLGRRVGRIHWSFHWRLLRRSHSLIIALVDLQVCLAAIALMTITRLMTTAFVSRIIAEQSFIIAEFPFASFRRCTVSATHWAPA